MGDLSFQKFALTVRSRAERWFPIEQWSGSDWATALAGEVGEVCDVVKKLNRAAVGRPGANDPPQEILLKELGNEIADVLTYANLLAQRYGVDVAEATARKFNAVSLREGFPERLELELDIDLTPEPEPTPDPSTPELSDALERNFGVRPLGEELKPPMDPPATHPADLDFRATPSAESTNKPRLRIVKNPNEAKKKSQASRLRKRKK